MNRNEFFDALPLTRITLKLTSATLEMCTDDIEEVHVMISGADGDVRALRVDVQGNQLVLEQPAISRQKNPIATSWLQVTLRLPRTWKGRIDARTITGWITLRHLNASDLTVDSVSGVINATGLLANTATMRTVTGDIRVADLVCTKAGFHTTSGAINVQHTRLYKANLSSITGTMTLALTEAFEEISATSVIGDLSVEAPIAACRVQHRSVAGRVNGGSVPQSEEATSAILFNTVSGSLDIAQPEPTP